MGHWAYYNHTVPWLLSLYSHDQLYKHICIQNHNDDTIKTSDTVLRKIYLSFYWKGCVWEGVGDRTELQHIDLHSIGQNHVSFPFSLAAQPGAWGRASLGAGFLYRILSPTRLIPNCSIGDLRAPSAGCWLYLPHLVSNWLNFLCTELYNSSTSTFLLWASQFRTHSTCPRSRL